MTMNIEPKLIDSIDSLQESIQNRVESKNNVKDFFY
jgi:hypothetical protein